MYTTWDLTILPLGGSTAILDERAGTGYLIEPPTLVLDGEGLSIFSDVFKALNELRTHGWRHESEEYDDDGALRLDYTRPERNEAGVGIHLLYADTDDTDCMTDAEVDAAVDRVRSAALFFRLVSA